MDNDNDDDDDVDVFFLLDLHLYYRFTNIYVSLISANFMINANRLP